MAAPTTRHTTYGHAGLLERTNLPPVLLTMAGYSGTLAAARCLGRAGIAVTMADGELLAPANWSRYVRRRLTCPPVLDTNRFMDWLLEFGRREPGHVLYPTSDDLAWLFARHASELRGLFRTYQPAVDVVERVLDKRSLHEAGAACGFSSPRTWYPESAVEIGQIERCARFPLLIKPRTGALLRSRRKGQLVCEPARLRNAFEAFCRENCFARELVRARPDLARPMVQECHRSDSLRVASVSGFVDRSGKLFVARNAVKRLQNPRNTGVGVCFEHEPLRPELESRVNELCHSLHYFGIFEVELLQATDGRDLLIDFNPRYFGQMAFDIARGVPLPLLAYFGATGNEAGLRSGVRAAAEADHGAPHAHLHWTSLSILLTLEQLSGRMSRQEVVEWTRWSLERRCRASNAAFDREDWVPGAFDVLNELYNLFRHPRALWRACSSRD